MTGGYLLPDRVFLITGAARGIGLEVARMAHARGASVVLTDVEGSGVEQAADLVGSRAIGLVADVRDSGQIEAAFGAAVERFGKVDVVVANAGIAPPITTVRAIDPDDWERVLDVNLMGVWRTVRAGLPQVLVNRGQFVLVSSSYAFMNGVLNSPYATAKAGVEALGRGLRAELLPRGASATVAYFGWIKTELVRKAFADPVVDRMRHEAIPSLLTRRVPVRRAGSAIIKGVETRAPRVIVPFEWRLLFLLRGLLGPFTDLGFERDPRVAEIVLEAEERSSRQS